MKIAIEDIQKWRDQRKLWNATPLKDLEFTKNGEPIAPKVFWDDETEMSIDDFKFFGLANIDYLLMVLESVEVESGDSLFLKVAAIAGWRDLKRWDQDPSGNTYLGHLAYSSEVSCIPRYDLDAHAITSLAAKHHVFPLVHRQKHDGAISWRVSAYPSAVSHLITASDSSYPIALCKLLIAIVEARSGNGAKNDN